MLATVKETWKRLNVKFTVEDWCTVRVFYVLPVLKLTSVGRYGPVMTDSSRLQQHHTTSDDPGQGCKAHEEGIRP